MDSPQALFQTLPFRISSSRYFTVILRRMLVRWLSLTILSLALLIGATCFDLRFGIILLMFIFIILPLILFIFYYNYALRPEAFFSVVEKSVIIHPQGIDCIYNEQTRNILYWKDVQRIEIDNKAFYIFTGNNTYFYLSREAFASVDDMRNFEKNFLPQIIS
ncbi:MAG: YcxB family protein [Bacteroidaceae bacterium]|nr:YcxB family protein [Bacteroidaceae bacterium]